jgi:antitoxin (DNA-binding transcriptional repressor) of toxin-antitoxin stability system
MDTVTVAQLKARLSYYLREVRAGKSYTVLSRDIPVATLEPYQPQELDELEIIPPEDDAPLLSAPVLGVPTRIPIDAVQLIREDRDDRDARLDEVVGEALRMRKRPREEPDERGGPG